MNGHMKAKLAAKAPHQSLASKRAKTKSPAPGKTPAARPVPPKRILVPLDFSSHSARALQYARTFARQFGARLALLHVVEAFPIDYILGLRSAKIANHYLVQQARARLQQVTKQMAGAGRAPDSWVAFGRPFREITRAAKERAVDLIILATHGYTGLRHIQLGSTAERVVRHAPCPVLVVRVAPSDEPRGKAEQALLQNAKPSAFNVRKILVPVDFSPQSAKALEYALPFARCFHSAMVLLHVIHADYLFADSDYGGLDYPELLDELQQAGRKQLGDLARSIPQKYPVTTVLKTGHPGYSIVETADKLGIDLIITATHGRTGFKRALLGSTAEFVVRHAHCPVLALREP